MYFSKYKGLTYKTPTFDGPHKKTQEIKVSICSDWWTVRGHFYKYMPPQTLGQ